MLLLRWVKDDGSGDDDVFDDEVDGEDGEMDRVGKCNDKGDAPLAPSAKWELPHFSRFS